jgi:glutamate-1-semialdehyde aminotransferase
MIKKIENFTKSRANLRKINDLIPDGAHTYFRGDDQFPVNFPGVITRDKRAYIQKQILLGTI